MATWSGSRVSGRSAVRIWSKLVGPVTSRSAKAAPKTALSSQVQVWSYSMCMSLLVQVWS